MKKFALVSIAVSALVSNTVFAATDYTPAVTGSVPTTVASAGETAQNFTYKGTTTGGFTVNDFTISLSSFVTLGTVESPTAMAVGAASARGSKVFTGTSNGGSVSSCTTVSGATATTAETDITGKTTLSTAKKNGCTESSSS